MTSVTYVLLLWSRKRGEVDVTNLYIERIAELELEIATGKPIAPMDTPEDRAMVAYLLSTPNRRNFGVAMVKSKLSGDYVSASYCVKLLGISRTATDTIIKECLAAGYIKEIDSASMPQTRCFYASDAMLEAYKAYVFKVAQIKRDLDILRLEVAATLTSDLQKLRR